MVADEKVVLFVLQSTQKDKTLFAFESALMTLFILFFFTATMQLQKQPQSLYLARREFEGFFFPSFIDRG